MKAVDLRAKTEDELKDELLALSKQKFNLRFRQANSQLENTAEMRTVRRNIARIKTVLNEKTNGSVETAAKKAPAQKAAAPKAKKTTAKKEA